MSQFREHLVQHSSLAAQFQEHFGTVSSLFQPDQAAEISLHYPLEDHGYAFLSILLGEGFHNGIDLAILLIDDNDVYWRKVVRELTELWTTNEVGDLIEVHAYPNFPPHLSSYQQRKIQLYICPKQKSATTTLLESLKVFYQLNLRNVLLINDVWYQHSNWLSNDLNEAHLQGADTWKDNVKNHIQAVCHQCKLVELNWSYLSYYNESEIGQLHIAPNPYRFMDLMSGMLHNYFRPFNEAISNQSLTVIPEKEIKSLRAKNPKLLNAVAETEHLATLRTAILEFLITCAYLSLNHERELRYFSMLVHGENSTARLLWQTELIQAYIAHLKELASASPELFHNLIAQSITEIDEIQAYSRSKTIDQDVSLWISHALVSGHLAVELCPTSENRHYLINEYTDTYARRNPLTIYVTNCLSLRGLSVKKLLSVFYSRSTLDVSSELLLEMRQVGHLSGDLRPFLRFYFPNRVRMGLKRIYNIEQLFYVTPDEERLHLRLVEFKPNTRLEPVSLQSINYSQLIAITASTALHPVGILTKARNSGIRKIVEELDRFIDIYHNIHNQTRDAFLMPIADVNRILDDAHETLRLEEGFIFTPQILKAILAYWHQIDGQSKDKIPVLLRKDSRHPAKFGQNYFMNPHLVPSPEDFDRAYTAATDTPCLILYREEGLAEDGWDNQPFYWPVLVMPANMTTTLLHLPDEE
jgi:hypothetical protein